MAYFKCGGSSGGGGGSGSLFYYLPSAGTVSGTVTNTTSDWYVIVSTTNDTYLTNLNIKINNVTYGGWKSGLTQIGDASSFRGCRISHVTSKTLNAGDTIELAGTSGTTFGIAVIICGQ